MNLREFWRFHFLKALLGLVAIQLIIIAIVQNFNHRPQAFADKLEILEGRTLKIKPLVNDTDKDEDTELILKDFTNPINGTILHSGNTLTYTPKAGFIGNDSLSYTISDGKKDSRKAFISITVTENLPPIAKQDVGRIYSGGKLIIYPLDNDEDREGDSIFIKEFTQPIHGNIALDGDKFIYSAAKTAAVDSFMYNIGDGKGTSKKTSVVINVQSKNNPCFPWLSVDIGKVGATGSFDCSNNKLTIEASGSDIWQTNDEFRFAYQNITGDCEIITKVESLDAKNEWAKAGVMIRENLKSGSRNSFLAITLENGITYQSRLDLNGGGSQPGAKTDIVVPYWLKIVRKGDNFTGLISTNGSNWEKIGSDNVPMSKDVYVGIGFTSHDNDMLGKAVFSKTRIR